MCRGISIGHESRVCDSLTYWEEPRSPGRSPKVDYLQDTEFYRMY